MKLRHIIPIAAVIVAVIGLGLYLGFREPSFEDYQRIDPALEKVISAYTHGEISRQSDIRIRFNQNMVQPSQLGKELPQDIVELDPAVDGKVYWTDRRTLVFSPEKPLPSSQAYKVDIDLEALHLSGSVEAEIFRFAFHTRPQDIQVDLTRSRALQGDLQQVQGIVRTLDYVPNEEIEEVLNAELGNENLRVSWEHDEAQLEHHFTIDSLPRQDQDQTLLLNWDGSPLGVSENGTQEVSVPAKGSFRLLHTYAYDADEQYLVIEFSEPLAASQELTGLIDLAQTDERFLIEENRVRIYPQTHITGPITLKISEGIRTHSGEELKDPYQEEVTFAETKPQVRLIGKGTILPKGRTMPLVFEAIGLNAIDVRVIKIYENNIPQFLQLNQISGHEQLKQVGQPVVTKRIDLNAGESMDLNQWNRHSLDLASLINTDPGAIYEIAIGFRPEYSLYDCASDEAIEDEVDMVGIDDSWYEFTGYYYERYRYYRWSERDDPCKAAYYNTERLVRRNILASDLGIIAKIAPNGGQATVTNLQTTDPMRDVELTFYDLQQQELHSTKTGPDGTVRLPTFEHPPFLLVAKHGDQRGYLRLDDGTSLSMTRFDTDGMKYHRGVKGMLYGERGVWRPGDPMYLNFILQDQADVMPDAHPVNFELVDPRGQIVVQRVLTEGTDGFYPFHVETDTDAPTGNYTARVKVGAATFTETFKVETILPNRLKLNLDFGREVLSASTQGQAGTLHSEWLHGATANGLKADVTVALREMPTEFDRYPNYHFDDPVRQFESDEQVIFEGTLNGEGNAAIRPNITVNQQAPGMLRANFTTKVYEPGGAFSVDRFSMPYSPYQTYVGVRAPEAENWRDGLQADRDHFVEIATVDPNGRATNSKVEVTLYRLDWRWWWDRSRDNVGSRRGEVDAEVIETTTINTVNGKGQYTLRVNKPRWGRFLIRAVDDQGHASGQIVYITWPGWNRNMNQEQEGAQMLTFEADKETYNVGETVKVDIPTGNAGRALVSLENGSDVLQSYWVDARQGNTEFSFVATEQMTPNLYVHISLLQPHAQTANDLPIRMYGVIPIRVENPETHLTPKIAMPETIRPNSDYTVQVSEATGQPMTYTLAVVDEGLLGLTRYHAPDPWQTFYRREALGVKTWDIYDDVLGAYGGEVKSLLSIGGGADDTGPKGKKPDRFRPVVEFIGPFELKPGETARHSFSMPNYIGEVRAMVVAGKPDEGAYGVAERSAKVKQPLMVLGTLPRVLGPGESVQLPVTVFAMEDRIREATVNIEVGDKMLVEGRGRKTVRFSSPGEEIVFFEVGVLSSIGKTPVKITVSSGSESAVYETDIEIRPPNPRVTDVYATTMEASSSWSQDFSPPGMLGTNHGVLEVSSIPPLNLGRRLRYLIRYPYGCIEQTTSSGFPQVYLSKLMDLEPARKREIDQNIRATLDRLRRFQTTTGGFAYWPGNRTPSEWGSNYAGHFMLEAQAAGYRIPGDMFDKWLKFQKSQALAYSSNGETAEGRHIELYQAYRLYLLALAGKPEVGAMNRFRRRSSPDPVAQWFLAGAYNLAGRQEVASRITNDLSRRVTRDYRELGYTYGSTLRDQSIILMILSEMDRRVEARDLVDYVSDRLTEDSWYSTQTTAYSLVAMAKFVGNGSAGQDMEFEYRLDSGRWISVDTKASIWQVEMDEPSSGKVEIRNRTRSVLFPRLVMDGIPLRGDTSSASNGLSLDISYADLNGKSINVSRLPQGTDFVAKVKVRNLRQRSYQELALDQIFPSGWEIINTRLDGGVLQGDTPEYRDIRDDRVYTFFDLNRNEEKTFYVRLNATYLGRYYLPTVAVSAMYDNSINARQPGKWVRVISAGGD